MRKTLFAGLLISGLIFSLGFSAQAKDGRGLAKGEMKMHRLLQQNGDQERILVGKVNSVATSSLEILIGKNKQFTVIVDSNDVILNRIWDKIAFGDIKTGDRIMAAGILNQTQMEAKFIRDLSLPQLPTQ